MYTISLSNADHYLTKRFSVCFEFAISLRFVQSNLHDGISYCVVDTTLVAIATCCRLRYTNQRLAE